MALTGTPIGTIKPIGLILNIVVSSIASIRFIKNKLFSLKVLFPVASGSIPAAFVGGYISLPSELYKSLVGLILILAGLQLIFSFFKKNKLNENKNLNLLAAVSIGVLIGFTGAILLISNGAAINPNQNYWYALLVIIATVMYAFNINIIKRHLQDIPPLTIAVGNFIVIIVPAFLVLIYSGFFTQQVLQGPNFSISIFYVFLLSLFGTAIAKVLFNNLVQISTPVFASSVTYIMPIVAVFWGLLDNEVFSFWQGIATLIILGGVYLANSKR